LKAVDNAQSSDTIPAAFLVQQKVSRLMDFVLDFYWCGSVNAVFNARTLTRETLTRYSQHFWCNKKHRT
jgi:hypothetical protein